MAHHIYKKFMKKYIQARGRSVRNLITSHILISVTVTLFFTPKISKVPFSFGICLYHNIPFFFFSKYPAYQNNHILHIKRIIFLPSVYTPMSLPIFITQKSKVFSSMPLVYRPFGQTHQDKPTPPSFHQ